MDRGLDEMPSTGGPLSWKHRLKLVVMVTQAASHASVLYIYQDPSMNPTFDLDHINTKDWEDRTKLRRWLHALPTNNNWRSSKNIWTITIMIYIYIYSTQDLRPRLYYSAGPYLGIRRSSPKSKQHSGLWYTSARSMEP